MGHNWAARLLGEGVFGHAGVVAHVMDVEGAWGASASRRAQMCNTGSCAARVSAALSPTFIYFDAPFNLYSQLWLGTISSWLMGVPPLAQLRPSLGCELDRPAFAARALY